MILLLEVFPRIRLSEKGFGREHFENPLCAFVFTNKKKKKLFSTPVITRIGIENFLLYYKIFIASSFHTDYN